MPMLLPLIAALVFLSWGREAAAGTFTGQASIIDGDTLENSREPHPDLGHRRTREQPVVPRRRQPSISMRSKGGKTSLRRLSVDGPSYASR